MNRSLRRIVPVCVAGFCLVAQAPGAGETGFISNPISMGQYFDFVTIKPDGQVFPMGTDVRVKLFKDVTNAGDSGNIDVPAMTNNWDYHDPGFVAPTGGWQTGDDWYCRLYDTTEGDQLDWVRYNVVTMP